MILRGNDIRDIREIIIRINYILNITDYISLGKVSDLLNRTTQ